MPRKSLLTSNPIRKIRMENHKTLEMFSRECGVSLQAVYLNEFGMYPTILPSVLRRLVTYYGCGESEIEEEYQKFVSTRRYEFGRKHEPFSLGEPDLRSSPTKQFRTILGFRSAFGWSKAISLNPTTVRRTESGTVEEFPGQLVIALREILLPVGDIEELQYRQREFVQGGRRSRV